MALPKNPDELIERLAKDEKFFIQSCLSVTDRETNRSVPFIFNAVQEWHESNKSDFEIVLKSRKLGFSTRFIASDIWACAFKPNQHAVLISHDKPHTSMLLEDRVKPLIRSSVFPLGATERADHIYFPRTQSRYYIGTAGTTRFGRGSDITRYHLSEYAHYEDPTLITGIEEGCLPGAVGRIETTANGENFFKKDWDRAIAGGGRYKPIFVPWFMDPRYQIEGATISDLTEEEQRLIEAFNLSHQQLAWRRKKINDMTRPELFPQEFPATANEAFLSSGRMVFDWVSLINHEKNCITPAWKGFLRDMGDSIQLQPQPTGNLSIWETPKVGNVYVIGADVAEGINQDGTDYSSAFVLDLASQSQVAEWHGKVAPDKFGDILVLMALFYNSALLVPESWPGPGAVTCQKIVDIGYTNIWQRPRGSSNRSNSQLMGWETTLRTRPQLILSFAGAIREYALTIKSSGLVEEMKSFVYDDNGQMDHQLGCHSDRIFSAAIAYYVSKDIVINQIDTKRKFRDIISKAISTKISDPKWKGSRYGVR